MERNSTLRYKKSYLSLLKTSGSVVKNTKSLGLGNRDKINKPTKISIADKLQDAFNIIVENNKLLKEGVNKDAN